VKKKSKRLTPGQRHRNKRIDKVAAKKDGDFIAVMRPKSEESKRHVSHCIGQLQLARADGRQGDVDRWYDLAGGAKAYPLTYMGLATKDARVMDPNSLAITGKCEPYDFLWPLQTALETMKTHPDRDA
jgi:hypothetical protein